MNVISDDLCAGEVMRRTFVTAEPEDTVGEVAQKLAKEDAGSALVVELGRLTGILTLRDVLRMVSERAHPSEARVREWMTAEPITASLDTPADEAARQMLSRGFHHLPVVEEGRPVGVVGLRSVIGALKTGFPGW
jgi:CBS domain-containing protein